MVLVLLLGVAAAMCDEYRQQCSPDRGLLQQFGCLMLQETGVACREEMAAAMVEKPYLSCAGAMDGHDVDEEKSEVEVVELMLDQVGREQADVLCVSFLAHSILASCQKERNAYCRRDTVNETVACLVEQIDQLSTPCTESLLHEHPETVCTLLKEGDADTMEQCLHLDSIPTLLQARSNHPCADEQEFMCPLLNGDSLLYCLKLRQDHISETCLAFYKRAFSTPSTPSTPSSPSTPSTPSVPPLISPIQDQSTATDKLTSPSSPSLSSPTLFLASFMCISFLLALAIDYHRRSRPLPSDCDEDNILMEDNPVH